LKRKRESEEPSNEVQTQNVPEEHKDEGVFEETVNMNRDAINEEEKDLWI